MDGQRTALIIASDEYEHPGLSRLRAPAADARALAVVLGDKAIGDFDVRIVHNAPAHAVEGQIEDLFAESQSNDLVLLHFSGHGLKSDSGELFFAARNTRPDRLGSTAVSADFIQRCMRASRARSIVLFLDCCYGGAFGQGVAVRAAGSAHVLENFPAGRLGGGRGRAVITASSAMEYAFEGGNLADEHQQQPSVFTSALVEGLSTGEADRDEDGLVSLNELYDYVFDRVRAQNPHQTPSRDVELQGELYLARSRRRRVRAVPIPADVATALKDTNMFTRLGAVGELRNRLMAGDPGAALGAHEALTEVVRSDIRYVADAAADALAAGAAAGVLDQPEVELGGAAPPTAPPTAPGTATSRAPEGTPPTPDAGLRPVETGGHAADPGRPPVGADVSAAATSTVGLPPRHGARPAREPHGTPERPGPHARRRLAGIAALVAGGLMLLGTLLDFQYDTVTHEKKEDFVVVLWLLGIVLVTAGTCALGLQARPGLGLGLVIGSATAATWLAIALAVTWNDDGRSGFNEGFWLQVVATPLALAAGVTATAGARRELLPGFGPTSSRDWTSWAAVGLGVVGSLPVWFLALDAWASERGFAAQTLWLALLSMVVPLIAVMIRPAQLGRGVLAGWAVGAAAVVAFTWFAVELNTDRSYGMPLVLLCLAGMLGLSPVLRRGSAPP